MVSRDLKSHYEGKSHYEKVQSILRINEYQRNPTQQNDANDGKHDHDTEVRDMILRQSEEIASKLDNSIDNLLRQGRRQANSDTPKVDTPNQEQRHSTFISRLVPTQCTLPS